MKTILVTGATGKLGSAVVGALVHAGFKVKAAASKTESIRESRCVQSVLFDFEDKTLYEEALSEAFFNATRSFASSFHPCLTALLPLPQSERQEWRGRKFPR
jgi:nucleoside-diphosphate-sugar epimerase